MRANVQEEDEGVRTTLRNLVAETEALIAALGAEGAQRYHDAVARLERQLRRARDDLDDLQYAAVRRARLTARRADRYVHDNPWKTAGTAAAVGAAVGAILAILVARR
jgi:ElaB/YqjD/DUF883 family membrane-anchored ribosome-binding protein